MVDIRLERHDPPIERSLLDLLHQIESPVLAPHKCQMRIGAREYRRDVGQQIGSDRGNDTQSERTVEGVAQVAGRLLEFALGAEHAPGLLDEDGAGSRYPHPMPAALKELHAQLRFSMRETPSCRFSSCSRLRSSLCARRNSRYERHAQDRGADLVSSRTGNLHAAPRTGRSQLVLLGLLYVAQALPLGFFVVALPAILRDRGVGLEKLGILGALALPFLLKFMWAPLVDRYGAESGHYRSWLLPLQALAVATVAAIAMLDPGEHLGWLVVLGALFMFLAATQDVATDGLAVRLLRHQERGLGNALQVGGYYLGQVLGGGMVLVLVDRLGWTVAVATMAAILALPLPLVAALREPAAADRAARTMVGLGTLVRFCRRDGMKAWMALLLTWRLGETMVQWMVNPMLVDRGFSLERIGLLLGVTGSLGALVGAAGAGWAIRALGRQKTLVTTGIILVAALAAHVVPALGLGGLAVVQTIISCGGVASGAATAALYTAAMDASAYDSAGTDFTLQQSMAATGPLLAASVSGFSAAAFGYAGHFTLAALVQLIVVTQLVTSVALRRGLESRARLDSSVLAVGS